MKILILAAACLFSITVFGQTKLIAFRSHSGNNANFHKAVEKDLFDIGNSNFGLPSTQSVIKVDSVILKSKREILLKIKTYVYRYGHPTGQPLQIVSRVDTLTEPRDGDFFRVNRADSLKAELKKRFRVYKTDSTVFIGFAKQFKQKVKSQKK